MSCIEVRVDDLRQDDGLIDQALRSIDDLLWELLGSGIGRGFLITTNGEVLPKSRLRSYRGLFSRDWKANGLVFEEEIDRHHGSFFVGAARLTEHNKTDCLSAARDIFRSCVLIAPEGDANALWEQVGVPVCQSLRFEESVRDFVTIDYCILIPRLAGTRRAVTTFGIDTRGEFVNARLFLDNALRPEYVSALRAVRARLGD